MPRKKRIDATLLRAALEGLELRKKETEERIAAVRSMLGAPAKAPAGGPIAVKPKRKRKLSAAARRRISEAQKQRWALVKAKAEKKASKKAAAAAKQGR